METAGFVPEPNCGRGTLSIIWACLPTIMFVVWTAIHPNSHESMSRAMWGVFIFFVPEAMPAIAIDQLIRARRLTRTLRVLRDWERWTLKQSFLVVKKGVRVAGSGETLKPERLVELAEEQQYAGRSRHAAYGSRGLRMEMLPGVDAIDRRSKKTWFEKLLAGGQAAWFCANAASRLAGGYPITPLEAMTVAYTCCGLVASVAWLHCPQDIEDPFEVDLGAVAFECGYSTNQESGGIAGTGEGSGGSEGAQRSPLTGSDGLMMGIVCVLLSVLAAIHLAEWNFPFPSAAEAWVWRGCSVAMLLIGLLILFYGDRCRAKHWSLAWTGPVYVVVRLALLTVAATAFRRMPLSVFDTPEWSDYWGHIGK